VKMRRTIYGREIRVKKNRNGCKKNKKCEEITFVLPQKSNPFHSAFY